MNGITHKQAKDYIHAELDGLLTDSQRSGLDAHLRECEACRIEAESLSVLATRLKSSLHDRWDGQYGPSENVRIGVLSHRGRIIMSNRIRFGMRTLAGIGALVVLGLIINFAFAQLRNPSIAVSGTGTTNGVKPVEQLPLIAFTSDQNGNSEIYTVHTDGTGLTNLTNNPAIDTGPYWSPNGSKIAFISNRDGNDNIYVMNFDGSNVIQLTNDPATEIALVWSPDGRKIAYASGSLSDRGSINHTNIYVVDVDSKKVNQVTYYTPYKFVWPQAWSPDSQYIFFGVDRQIVQVGVDGGDVTPITTHTEEGIPLNISLSEDGTSLLYLGGYGTIQCEAGSFCFMLNSIGIDGTNYKKLATLKTPELCKLKQTSSDKRSLRKWSPDRTKILFYFGCEDAGWNYIANADGSDFQPLTIGNRQNLGFDVDWSPDSQSIVFTSNLDRAGNADIYTVNINDALADPSIRPTRITDAPSYDSSPAWQPVPDKNIAEEEPTPEPTKTSSYDGLIAFVSGQENGNEEIFTMKADGSGLTNLTNDPATDTSPAWSPDGSRIAFGSDRRGDMDIYVMDADGSNVSRLTDDRGFEGYFSWSPDGQKIVYVSSDNSLNENGQLMIMHADGSNKIALTSEPGSYNFLDWSPNGKKILFEDLNSYPDDSGMRYVNEDGSNTGDGLMGVGDGLHRYARWENSDQYVFASLSGTWDSPKWELITIYAVEPSPQYNFGPVLYSSDSPIVAIFDRTFLVENNNTLTWLVYEGGPLPFSSWDFNERCIEPSNLFQEDSVHFVSPNRQKGFVAIHCAEGATWFYLESADGSQFVQLTDFSVPDPSQVSETSWSPDGKYVTMIIDRIKGDTYIGADLYLFDIERMLNDPSVKPIQLTVDGALKYGAVWQPVANNNSVEEKPTPEPLTFSLTVKEAETQAGFDVLESSYLPAGYSLEGAAYNPLTQQVAMKYVSQQSEGVLFIYQQHGDFVLDPTVQAYITPVSIGDIEGKYLRGAWIYDSPETTTPRWDGAADTYSLTWQKGEKLYTITFIGGETIPPILIDDLVAIAKNMK